MSIKKKMVISSIIFLGAGVHEVSSIMEAAPNPKN